MYMKKHIEQPYVGSWVDTDVPEQPGVDRTAYRAHLTEEQYRRMRAGYMGCITHIDYQLGFMQEVLTRSKLWGDTLVIFTADHGDMMGDHHLLRKSYAYEGSARIPFVIKYPNGWDRPTGSFEQVVGLQDIMPTCLDAAGVEIPDSVTGSSSGGNGSSSSSPKERTDFRMEKSSYRSRTDTDRFRRQAKPFVYVRPLHAGMYRPVTVLR